MIIKVTTIIQTKMMIGVLNQEMNNQKSLSGMNL